MAKNPRVLCASALILAAQFPTAKQNHFTDAQAGGIKAFLGENFANTNAGMVIAPLDENGSRLSAPEYSTIA